ncbi:Formiminotransferase domain, N-terminal subdomain [Seminavis robusta]|uniref:Formiminotransferase domain, N-terminal subdomain n=1 Tax=Seminavis robusta TaxID=568900 RepID=A0A9N8EQR4_9STRA|nr:Formiminotransferase domain, N-terminal subdomain [Seminavis robusta]|eukprot:Sro1806_g298870.1 Formiminotransferase domain, N-terminal subdomain (373) ;mRNA; r:8075-9193
MVNSRLLIQPLLGCNVYISAGGSPRHIPFLLDILKKTQEHCAQLGGTSTSSGEPNISSHPTAPEETAVANACVVVHAFSDVVYNRSSIHLAANSEDAMARVVIDLVQNARSRLSQEEEQDDNTEFSSAPHHPSVGLVDHVSVMPLLLEKGKDEHDVTQDNQLQTPWGRTARAIGTTMADTPNVAVFFYGDADPHQTPLATVRRDKTNFFQSGGLLLDSDNAKTHVMDTATVGAPPGFVENYNIRLHACCDKKMAQSLTRAVRERNGGVAGVEALTLPYSQGRYEVACNLLQPRVGSAECIQKKVDEWVQGQTSSTSQEELVECAYRVGTTASQCLEALELALEARELQQQKQEQLERHNESVWQQFKGYLSQ